MRPTSNPLPQVNFVVKMFFKPEDKAAVHEAMVAMTEPTRNEPGCVSYIGHWMKDEPNTLAIYEQYVDDAAMDAHRNAPYFKQWVEGVMVAKRTGVVFEYMDVIG